MSTQSIPPKSTAVKTLTLRKGVAAPVWICDTKDREAWLKERKLGIGSSDAAAILGSHNTQSFADPLSVYYAKIDPEDPVEDPQNESELLFWGKKLEPVIAEVAAERLGGKASFFPIMVAHPKRLWQRATVDCWLRKDGKVYPLEIKNVGWYIDKWDEGPPEHIWIQVQHQIVVLNVDKAYIAALFRGNELRTYEVKRDYRFTQKHLIPREMEFWNRVQEQNPPDPTGLAVSRKALNRIYPVKPEEQAVDISEVWEEDQELESTKEKIAELKLREEELKNKIIKALEGSKEGMVGRGRGYTYYPNKNGVRTLRSVFRDDS